MPRPTVLCLSSYFKGNAFIERAKQEGCHTILLTLEQKLKCLPSRRLMTAVVSSIQ
ncbi:MAG TPA: hypothetical protein PKA06_14085 [Gemmatales bacterium]|nr:hypothetical protein [Gemmatales bacterium]